MLHKSAFNQAVYSEATGTWALYNFLNTGFITLSPAEKEAYDALSSEKMEPHLLQELTEKGFLTEEDESRLLKERCRDAINAQECEMVMLTVCPTMDCNFACPYCVETGQKRRGRMSPETVFYLKRFFDRLLDESHAKMAFLNWYGGEPTLETGIIEELSGHFLYASRLRGVGYSASITTNGYLLDEDCIVRLEKAGVDSYRITVDGTEETHDCVRVLAGGQGTYRRIMENVRRLSLAKKTVEIRCNVSRQNAAATVQLSREVAEIGAETGNPIHFHCARMMVYRGVPAELRDIAMTEEEFSDFCLGIDDCKDLTPLRPLEVPCRACLKYSYCIDEQGDIYKCNSFLGMKEHALGNVSDLPRAEDLERGADCVFIREHAFPERKDCLECKLLPVCMGSCPLSSEKRCHRLKQHPERAVLKMMTGADTPDRKEAVSRAEHISSGTFFRP